MDVKFICSLCLFVSVSSYSVPVEVQIQTQGDDALAGGVVYLTSDSPLPGPAPDAVAVMDQVNRQFAPHILVVQKGARVSFPNSDSIKHHVYSFSDAKTFELELYKDRSPEPLSFETSGEVELGCNVHDWMLGYIYVVDTPYFTRSDKQGLASLDVPEGNYQLHLTHPRLDEPAPVSQSLTVSGPTSATLTLSRPLRAKVGYQQEEDEFIGY